MIRRFHLETLRHARVCLLGADGTQPPREIWYLLHGYGQSAERFLARFESISAADRLLVAPEGLSRFYPTPTAGTRGSAEQVGASWMTREDRGLEIDDYVRYLNRVALSVETAVGKPSRTVLGFSQGAHTAARWATLGNVPMARLILWGSGLPTDLPDEAATRLADTDLLLVRGAEDPFRSPDDEGRDESWLRENRVRFRVQEHGGGHKIVEEVLEAVAQHSKSGGALR